ncbi:MAG: hypothetical protein ACM3UQ_00070 [Clostridiales bacterium]
MIARYSHAVNIDEEMAREIAINFLTHNKMGVTNCSAILKGNVWHVEVTLDKNVPETRVVQIDAGSGKITNSGSSMGGIDKSKLGALAFGIYCYVVNTFCNDAPTQGATSLMSMVTAS